MSLKRCNLLLRVEIEYSLHNYLVAHGCVTRYELEIIAPGDNPIFPCDESSCTDGYFGDIKCPQQRRRLIVVNVDFSIVQGAEDPAFCGMKVDSLDTVGAAGQQLFDLRALDLQRLSKAPTDNTMAQPHFGGSTIAAEG
jgi:hypothetical protein